MWISFPPFSYFLYYFILWSSSNRTSFPFRSRLYSEEFFFFLDYQVLCLTSFLITVALFAQGPYVLSYFSSYSLSAKTVFAKRKNEEFFSSVFTCMVVLFQSYSWTAQWSILPLSNCWFKTRSFSGFGFVIFVF